jgi:5-methylcytosine-specific restriction endonuclease McrA
MFHRRRRSANLRYRAARFNNRRRPLGWLAPSLHSRLDNIIGWVDRYRRYAPITTISVEHVRFDIQRLLTPDIDGVEYQQGELTGYELREYLLEKWGRTCAYCAATQVPLQMDHIYPQARGGSNRVSNLTLACRPCNEKKGAQSIEQFLLHAPDTLHHILATAQRPLDAAAAINTVRWALVEALRATTLPLELGTGGQTKWNRSRLHIPKEHCLDAACVGVVDALHGWTHPILAIACTGRGSYQRTRLTAHGFPRGYLMRHKTVRGFQTGDMVRAIVPSGLHAGTHTGRVAVRATAKFNIQTSIGVIQGINAKHCTRLTRADGYAYHIDKRARPIPIAEARGLRRGGV